MLVISGFDGNGKLVTQVSFVVRTQEKLLGPLATLGMKVEFVERLPISEISRGIGVVRVEKGLTGNQKVYLHSKSHQLLSAINDKRNNGSFLGSAIDFPSVASLLSFVNSNQKLGRLG